MKCLDNGEINYYKANGNRRNFNIQNTYVDSAYLTADAPLGQPERMILSGADTAATYNLHAASVVQLKLGFCGND